MTKANPIAKCLLAAALLWAPAARALLLTTWALPANIKALDAEYAANTNVVTILNLNQSDDGIVTMVFRDSEGQLGSLSLGEDEFLARFSLVKVGGKGLFSKASARAVQPMGQARSSEVRATDKLDNYSSILSEDGATWLGGAGGEEGDYWGGEWRLIAQIGDTAEATFHDEEYIRMSLETKGCIEGQGEVIAGRDLKTPLASGSFSINAWLDEGSDFRGFAVYDEDDNELFRFGNKLFSPEQEGYVYAFNQGGTMNEVLFFDEGTLSAKDGVEYTLSWSQLDNGQGLSFSLSESTGYWTKCEEMGLLLAPITGIEVLGATSVSTVAIIASGNTRIAFDQVTVTGTPVRAVPEPGTLGLLAAGLGLLAARRRRG